LLATQADRIFNILALSNRRRPEGAVSLWGSDRGRLCSQLVEQLEDRVVTDQAIAKAINAKYARTLALAYWNEFYTYWMLRDRDRLVKSVDTHYALLKEHGLLSTGIHLG
jgi:hypothetical protein